MRATDIAFVNLVGIKQDEEMLSLEYKDDVQNHLQTIHASAQFTLAETQSGLYLQALFPELEGNVLPVLRESNIKYKKPALKDILAYPTVSEEGIEKFSQQFEKKGRGTIEIKVEVKDIDGVITAVSTFTWFIQKI